MKSIIQRINDLANYLSADDPNRDFTFKVICTLHQFNDEACKSEYSKQELEDLIVSKKYLLTKDKLDHLPAKMIEDIKNLQQEIIDTYGLQD